jgi:uncharacterized membrane protein
MSFAAEWSFKMFNRQWFKQLAREQMSGNVLMLAVITFLVSAVGGAIGGVSSLITNIFTTISTIAISAMSDGGENGFVFFVGFIFMFIIAFVIAGGLSLLIAPVTLGHNKVYLRLTEGEAPDINVLFSEFSRFKEAALMMLIIAVKTMLWSFLFFVPGIIASLRYSQAFYILAENPGMTANEAIEESKRITDGYKMDLFITSLSFIGWGLLGGLTLGILNIVYVTPYMNATFANCYRFLKEQN